MEQQIINNKRESVLLGVKLSFILMIVAIITGVCYTIAICFPLENSSFIANSFYLASYMLLLASIYNGGKGINQIRKEGFKGNWEIKYEGRNYFSDQTLCLLSSICFFSVAVLFL